MSMSSSAHRLLRHVGLALAVLSVGLIASAAFAQTDDGGVIIGVLGDQSGQFKDNSGPGAILAATMAVEDFGGTVLGHKITVVSGDHQMKADIGSAIARKWYDADHVDMITDLTNSSVALAVQQLARERGKIAIFTSPGTADLTGKFCSSTGFHWVYDTYSNGHELAVAAVKQGLKSWFFIAADFAFGHSLVDNLNQAVTESGGTVLGAVFPPLGASDFSSFVLKAQSSHAQVIAVANSNADLVNTVKQAAEFGLTQSGQHLVTPILFLSDIRGLGLAAAQGLTFVNGFYWDTNPETRAWSQRFFARAGVMPEMTQAGTYSGVMHYLKAVQAAGTKDGPTVAAKMRAMKVDDFFSHGGVIREDGRMVHDMYLMEVKTPAESTGPFDLLKQLSMLPGDEAFLPLALSVCPLVKK
jgi:branched-chain amino acid transport system substrate-binding protein